MTKKKSSKLKENYIQLNTSVTDTSPEKKCSSESKTTSYRLDMNRYVKRYVDRYYELIHKPVAQIQKVTTSDMDDQFRENFFEIMEEWADVWENITLTFLYHDWAEQIDVSWPVTVGAWSVANKFRIRDKRQDRFINYGHFTMGLRYYYHIWMMLLNTSWFHFKISMSIEWCIFPSKHSSQFHRHTKNRQHNLTAELTLRSSSWRHICECTIRILPSCGRWLSSF